MKNDQHLGRIGSFVALAVLFVAPSALAVPGPNGASPENGKPSGPEAGEKQEQKAEQKKEVNKLKRKLRRLHSKFDGNNDGKLSSEERKKMMKRAQELMKKIREKEDKDKIPVRKILHHPAFQAERREIKKSIDQNDDGKLNEKEAKTYRKRVQELVKKYREMMKNGEIVPRRPEEERKLQLKLQKLRMKHDSDQDGKLTKKERRAYKREVRKVIEEYRKKQKKQQEKKDQENSSSEGQPERKNEEDPLFD